MPDAAPSFRVLHEDANVCAVVKPNRFAGPSYGHRFPRAAQLTGPPEQNPRTRCMVATRSPIGQTHEWYRGLRACRGSLNALKLEFVHRRTSKTYYAVVRGWTEDQGVVEKPLPTAHNPVPKEAQTDYRTLARVELPHPVGPYETARYSVVECRPSTGRFHQIRLSLPALAAPHRGRFEVRGQEAQPVCGQPFRGRHTFAARRPTRRQASSGRPHVDAERGCARGLASHLGRLALGG